MSVLLALWVGFFGGMACTVATVFIAVAFWRVTRPPEL